MIDVEQTLRILVGDDFESVEEWRDIPMYSGLYEVSNLGRVRSCPRDQLGPYGSICHRKSKIKKQHADSQGYLFTHLTDCSGKSKDVRVHRLVASAFLSDWNPDWPWTVNHHDGDKHNNCASNLEMMTTQDNTHHYHTAECFQESRNILHQRLSKSHKDMWTPELRKHQSNKQKERFASMPIEDRRARMCHAKKYQDKSMYENRIWIHNACSEKWVHISELDDYMHSGWVRGRLKHG